MYIHCTWSRSRSPFLLRFGHGPLLVQINLQHGQAQPFGICSRYLPNSNLFICGASHREAVSAIFKVFDK